MVVVVVVVGRATIRVSVEEAWQRAKSVQDMPPATDCCYSFAASREHAKLAAEVGLENFRVVPTLLQSLVSATRLPFVAGAERCAGWSGPGKCGRVAFRVYLNCHRPGPGKAEEFVCLGGVECCMA